MAVVVAGVVDDFHVREAEETDDENAKQGDETKLSRTRSGRRYGD
jgi:hypothetical protein